jgi:salicylate hydroxylase
VVDTASKNAGRYHLSAPPVRMAAHLGLTIASTLAPKAMMGHFDWIYRYDVTKDS